MQWFKDCKVEDEYEGAPYVENIVRPQRRDANVNIIALEGPIAGLITEIRDIAASREESAAYEFQMKNH